MRWNADEGYYEGRCDACLDWYSLEPEARHDLWPVKGRGLRICRACDSLKAANRIRRRRLDPAVRAAEIAANHLRYTPEERRAMRRADLVSLDRRRAYQREYMRRKRAAA